VAFRRALRAAIAAFAHAHDLPIRTAPAR